MLNRRQAVFGITPFFRVGLPRTYKMGFANYPPRYTTTDILENLRQWSSVAEVALIFEEPPWSQLLGGMTPEEVVETDYVPIVNLFRSNKLELIFMGDPAGELERGKDSLSLQQAGRSIVEPEIQDLFRKFVLAINKFLKPEVIGLGAETNLVRLHGTKEFYNSVKQVSNDCANDLKYAGFSGKLLSSIQVEIAWGYAQGGIYQGIQQDLDDFSFANIVGLSSYPYFVFQVPSDIPNNYYSKLTTKPMAFIEGGWNSESVNGRVSSEYMQAQFLNKNSVLLSGIKAKYWTQLMYADIAPGWFPLDFQNLGITRSDWTHKPAFNVWKNILSK
jgi:hypothetical protein